MHDLFAQYGKVLSARLLRGLNNDTGSRNRRDGLTDEDEEVEEVLRLDRPTIAGKQPFLWKATPLAP